MTISRSRPRITARLKSEGQATISISMAPSVLAHLRALARKHDLDLSKMIALLIIRATRESA